MGLILLIAQAANGFRALTARGLLIAAPPLLAGAFILTGLASGVQMLAWRGVMRGLGVRLGAREVLQGYMMSFLPRYIPGSVWGYLGRNEWLFQEHGVGYADANLGSLLEMLASVTGVVVVVGINFGLSRPPATFLGLVAALVIVPAGIWVILKRAFTWSFAQRLPSRLIAAALFSKFSLSAWLLSVALFTVHWFLNGSALGLTLWALYPATIVPTSVMLSLSSTYSLAWLIGFIVIFAPAGLGFRELALTSSLMTNFGLATGQANGVSVMFRLIMIASELAWVLLGVALGRQKVVLPLKK